VGVADQIRPIRNKFVAVEVCDEFAGIGMTQWLVAGSDADPAKSKA
jgi:hypothetical protein